MEQQKLYLPSSQIKGVFDKRIKHKIAMEEWFQDEIEYQQQQYSEKLNIRIIFIEALFQRPNYSVSAFWYEFTENHVWVFVSYPIIKKLDQNLFSLFTKIIVDTIYIYSKEKKENGKKTLLECEREAFKLYIEDMNRIRSTKALANAERLKQVVFLLINQYYREKIPTLNSKNIVPTDDSALYEIINTSFSRLKNNLYDYQKRQSIGSIKLRMIPYIFQDIAHDDQSDLTNPLKLKIAQSIITKNQQDKNLFAIIIFTSQFIELLNINSKLLDYIIAYEIISIENALKFNRGIMEQEILSIVSKDQNASERSLYSFFSKEEIQQAKLELEKDFEVLLFEKKVNVLRIID